MTDREKELIAAYIPSPRDETLGDFDYFVKDCAGRIYKVHIVGIYPQSLNEEVHYSVYTDGGKRITDFTGDGNFPMRHIYDNKQDCKDETHNFYSNWEQLREIQRREIQDNLEKYSQKIKCIAPLGYVSDNCVSKKTINDCIKCGYCKIEEAQE